MKGNMDNICQFKKFGYCKMKSQCKNFHVRGECENGSHYANLFIKAS